MCEKGLLQVLAGEFLAQLQGPGGVFDYLLGLHAGDVGKEPAAAGVHEQGVALHFQEFQGRHPIAFFEVRHSLLGEIFRQGPGAAVQNHLDIGIPGGPGVW